MSVAFATAARSGIAGIAAPAVAAPPAQAVAVSAPAQSAEQGLVQGLAPAVAPLAAAAMLAAGRRRGRRGAAARKVARPVVAGGTAASGKEESKSTTMRVASVDLEVPDVDFDEQDQEAPKPQKHDQFDWEKAWYPCHVTEMMDPVRPHKFQLMGMHLVAWNDGPTVNGEKMIGKWHVMKDACPHRMAPLSEGRVEEDGSLLCSYHAWRFNGDGECTDLPYSKEELQPKHKCSCRAKCTVFPVREEDGLLFVWPEPGEKGMENSKLKEPQLIEELHDPELSKKWIKFPINLRDLELGWDVFFENAMDPSHFLVAHHNITGNRYTDPKWFDMKTSRALSTEGGVAVRGIPGEFNFRPPCLVKNQQDGGVIFAIYNTPTSPGKCRHIGFLVLDTDTIAGDSGVVDKDAVSMFTGPVPIWLQHLGTSFFLHQDAVLLHHQEQNFKDAGFEARRDSETKFREVTYTPNEVDKGSIQFRRWLKTRAGGGVPWKCDPTLAPRLQSNDKIFDVWNSHTKHCKHCLEAYKNIEMAKNASYAAAFTAALAMPDGIERVAAGAACVACGAALQKVSDLFVKYEFNHQDNN